MRTSRWESLPRCKRNNESSVDGGACKKTMPSTRTQWSQEKTTPIFLEYLRAHGIKKTQSRLRVLEVILDFHEHFEVEQVVYALKERGHRIGRATVYRTLPLLVEAGILREVRFGAKQTHYEHALDRPPHDHLVCDRCGRIVEFDSGELLTMRQNIAAQSGFTVLSHQLQITGLCPECRKGNLRG